MVSGSPYGSTCAQAVAGVKPKRRQRAQQKPDARQPDLFAEAAAS